LGEYTTHVTLPEAEILKLKEFSSMLAGTVPISINVNWSHLKKAPPPMLDILSPITIELNADSMNAACPIETTSDNGD
jgi:hypothetical protein